LGEGEMFFLDWISRGIAETVELVAAVAVVAADIVRSEGVDEKMVARRRGRACFDFWKGSLIFQPHLPNCTPTLDRLVCGR
jgi:hypothetical protein